LTTFTAKDISVILKACAASGVTQLKLGDLEVTLAETLAPHATSAFGSHLAGLPDQSISADPSVRQYDDDVLEEFRRTQLMLEDPLGFEQQEIDAQLREKFHANRDDIEQN